MFGVFFSMACDSSIRFLFLHPPTNNGTENFPCQEEEHNLPTPCLAGSLYIILGSRLCRKKGWQLTYYLYWDDWNIIQVSINSPNGLSWSSTKNRCCSPIAASVFTISQEALSKNWGSRRPFSTRWRCCWCLWSGYPMNLKTNQLETWLEILNLAVPKTCDASGVFQKGQLARLWMG